MSKSPKKPKVSIITPSHNSENTLSECLKSIFNQNYSFYEVIVVDNFSNDTTPDITVEFKAKVKRARTFKVRFSMWESWDSLSYQNEGKPAGRVLQECR